MSEGRLEPGGPVGADATGTEAAGTKRRYRSRDERRAEIVDATLEILVEEGMHAWTTGTLAERVGCSEGTLFKHFESKDEILTEALRQQARALRRRVAEYRGSGSGREKAMGLILDILGWVAEARGGPLVILLGHAARIHPEMGEEVGRTMGRLRGRLEEFLGEDAAAGRAPDGVDASILAQLYISVGHSSALRWMVTGRRGSPDEIARPMLEMLETCGGNGEGR